ncbi:hypothetical protein RESH_00510 [Rhodopirellula europaea SH398]|uniref:Uncharacterized protein n=2 Tax=Rhodopirellula europaea TaxID=1263866 RepID=M5SBY4_9BACT|nr:hypothetical protein RE6C_02106 [Rhodopirellula europaea 6C]EMI29005.1 hypothetical protein RESH_00510 [Rhodopirellula europaea SH398]
MFHRSDWDMADGRLEGHENGPLTEGERPIKNMSCEVWFSD